MKYHFTPAFFAARRIAGMSIWPAPRAASFFTSVPPVSAPVGVPFLHVFQVNQFPTLAVFLKQLHGVLVGEHHPEDVHLIADIFRVRLLHEQIEQRALAERLKLVAMAVIEELQAVFGERLRPPG